MKLRQKLIALPRPTNKTASSQKIRRIPYAVISDETIQCRWHNHRQSARNAAFDSRHHAERLKRQQLAMAFVQRQPRQRLACARNLDEMCMYVDRHVMLVRQYLEEPAHNR